MATFGAELRRLRIQAKKTLADVAAVLSEKGVSVPYVSDIERERRNPPSRAALKPVLEMLGCEDQLDRMMELAAMYRGSVEIASADARSRRVLVALERKMQDEGLSEEAANAILRVLESGGK